jgi:metacaspase-1
MIDPIVLQQAEEYIPAEIHLLSGCRDEETSADVSNVATFGLPDPAGRAGGACTSALLKTLYAYNINTGKGLSYADVLTRMRAILQDRKMTQIPQLSSSRPLDVHENWKLVPDNFNGTKRAVMIAINYKGLKGELTGCHNDINHVRFLFIG